MKIRKIQHISKRPQKYLKFDLRYSMPKYGKISTLKIIFFSFRLYIKIFEIFSFLLIPNMSYFSEIWISLLVSRFHGIAQYTLKTIFIQCEITIWVVWKLSLLVFWKKKKKFTKNIYSMWKLNLFFSIFIFISSKMFLHSLLLNSDAPFTGQHWIILNIFYQYDGNCVCVFFF